MNAVRKEQRFTKTRPCPICGGADNDARGGGRRCSGYISSDGTYAHCSREEQAGPLQVENNGTTYAHRLAGSCKCGMEHGEVSLTDERVSESQRKIVATYRYCIEDGALAFEVVRFEPKTFRQRRSVDGKWVWNLEGTRRVLYRLPELAAADPALPVFVVEGEKDADALAVRGFVSTTSPAGAKNWNRVDGGRPEVLCGRDVVVIPDDDEPGAAHAAMVKASLEGHAARVRIAKLPAKDVSDWFAAGHTADELRDIIANGLDDEPGAATVDPFAAELERALVDVKAKLETANAPRPPMFGDAVELLATTFDAPRWLVTGLVTRGGITMIGAEPKTAKTWLALELALAVASGTKALGEFYAEHGRVAYFLAEDMNVQARNRVRALIAGASRTLEAGRLFLQPRGVFLDILRDEDLAYVIASCRRLGAIDLLVLDPLRDIHDGEEDKSDSMRNVMRRLRVLAELLGCTVAVVHHAPKMTKDNSKRRPGQNLRGSSAIHGSIDSGLYLDESNGDGTNLFTNTVTSQVKGARSAGRFSIELAVKDNDQGEAVEARWTFTREVAKKSTTKAAEPTTSKHADDLTVAAWVRGLPASLTRTALRQHDSRPIAEKRITAALDRLIEDGILAVQGGLVTCTRPVQMECSLDA